MPKRMLGVLMTTGLVVAAGAAVAQSNPTADSIINSLTPRAGMGGMTRGIRPLAPAAPAPAEQAAPVVDRPAVAPAPSASSAQAAPSVNLTVQFANGSAELTPAAMRTLDELGRALSSNALASFHFRIEGHTDTVGAPEQNQSLSERRAQAVVAYITSKFHVDASRLEPVGMGESHLLVPTGQNVAEPRNRRVTVVNVGA